MRLTSDAKSMPRLASLQVLRAIPALAVVVLHASGKSMSYGWDSHSLHSISKYGNAGVDIFFVISGFIMVVILRDAPRGLITARSFFIARLNRIVPLYWLLTTAWIALLILFPSAFGLSRFNLWHTLASLFFIPSANPMGVIAPDLDVGWTLNYEMWFYVLFTALVCITRHRIVAIFGLITLVSTLGFLHKSLGSHGFNAIYQTYTNSIIMEFAFGCVLGGLYIRKMEIHTVAAVACAAVTVLFFASPLFAIATDSGQNRFLVYGLPALSVVALAVSLEHRVPWNRFLQHLGDASYSLYLTHAFSVPATVKLLQLVDRTHRLPGILVCIAAIGVSVFVALMAHRYLEKPLGRLVRRGFHWTEISPVTGVLRNLS
jgi:peptidoglycan/LPS O-acetylase OafA/YrhL